MEVLGSDQGGISVEVVRSPRSFALEEGDDFFLGGDLSCVRGRVGFFA